MTDELEKNFDDTNKTNKILNDMLEVLGEEPMFKAFDDFCKFMESDEPLVF